MLALLLLHCSSVKNQSTCMILSFSESSGGGEEVVEIYYPRSLQKWRELMCSSNISAQLLMISILNRQYQFNLCFFFFLHHIFFSQRHVVLLLLFFRRMISKNLFGYDSFLKIPQNLEKSILGKLLCVWNFANDKGPEMKSCGPQLYKKDRLEKIS